MKNKLIAPLLGLVLIIAILVVSLSFPIFDFSTWIKIPASFSLTTTGTIFSKKQDMEICKEGGNDCVLPFNALMDIYKSVDSVDNFGVIQKLGIVSVRQAALYRDKSDEYAVFLTQFNKFENGTIQTCHACSAVLGLAIYQYHNGWKLFASSPHIADTGTWGKAFDGSSIVKTADFDIQSAGTEAFYLLIRSTDGGQGHNTEYINVVEVRGGSHYWPSRIQHLGMVDVASENCSGNDDKTNDWLSKNVRVVVGAEGPEIHFEKYEREVCETNAPLTHVAEQTLVYDRSAKEWVPR